MSALLATIPLQLVCQLIAPETPSNQTNFANHNPAQIKPESHLPDDFVISGGKLASLPLELVCQLIVANNPVITKNGDLVELKKFAENPSPILPNGYKSFPGDNSAYKIYEEISTWDEARDRCKAENAHLAIADTHDKITHINSLKKERNNSLHVGIQKSNSTDEWVRVDDGRPVAHLPWISEHPDGIGNCAGISKSDVGLVNYPCTKKSEYYVCEIKI